MARGLRNWNYKDVIKFLKRNDFRFYKEKMGSHEAWIRTNESGTPFIVEVNKLRGGKTYPPRTLETMIRQSGITKKKWREG